MSSPADPMTELQPLELHYFRIPRERWELMLARLRQMGANAVSTIVPWAWHAPSAGVFDLTGLTHPLRNVADFLAVCQAMAFRVIIRPAPYVGAGLLGGGVPPWLLYAYPEACALGPDDQPRRDPESGGGLPSAEHPTYLKHLDLWYQALSAELASWQWPAGPIVAVWVDRPATGDAQVVAGGVPVHWDYNPHVVKVQWPVWLRQQYQGIDALNAAWQTDHRSFGEAAFPRQTATGRSSPELGDAARFMAHTVAHATEAYAAMLREMGWTVPIAKEGGAWSVAVQLNHAVQIDPEVPQVGAGVRWAMDAPVRADGSPGRQFWAVKTALLGGERGTKPVEGGILVAGLESRRVRLARPASDYGTFRLLLDGQLLDASSRARGKFVYLDYVVADRAGETEIGLFVNDRTAPLGGFLREHLVSLLMGKAEALRWASVRCRAVAEAFSGVTFPPTGLDDVPFTDDLLAAEQSLAEARRAAQRAATSLGRLERLASEVRGEMWPTVPVLPEPAAFSPQELERLAIVRDVCAQVSPRLGEAAQSIQAICQNSELSGQGLTVDTYRAAWTRAHGVAREASALLMEALARVRSDQAAGALSPAAWSLENWLTCILNGLTAGWLG